jgi:type IV pilus assembly protein PilX
MVLVVMAILMVGALAAVRSTETSTLVAGNSAFREATKQVADVGVNAAFAYVAALGNPEVDVPNRYFALRQTQDAYGMPSTVSWSDVAETTVQSYKIQYVVERLCTGVLPVTNVLGQCVTESAAADGSNKLGSPEYTTPPTTVYRITVRTRGPKNSESYTQALMSR